MNSNDSMQTSRVSIAPLAFALLIGHLGSSAASANEYPSIERGFKPERSPSRPLRVG